MDQLNTTISMLDYLPAETRDRTAVSSKTWLLHFLFLLPSVAKLSWNSLFSIDSAHIRNARDHDAVSPAEPSVCLLCCYSLLSDYNAICSGCSAT